MEKKTRTIAFANNKGGSGKTTSCANIGYSLAVLGKKVLLIDGDMQLNLSLSFFTEDKVLEFASGEKNLYYGIKKQADLQEYIVHTPYENLDLIPSSVLMSGFSFYMEYVIGAQAQTTQVVPAVREADERMGTFRKTVFPKVIEACIAFSLA